jgi:O-antigen/teichoic acid export membrane protein
LNWDHLRSVIHVSGGVILGQLIAIFGFLLLTWVYRPPEFGIYASWLAIVTIGSVVSTGALETSLVRDSDGAGRRDSAACMVWTAFLGAALFAALCGLGLVAFPHLLPGNRPATVATIGIAAFAMATILIFQSWAAAEGLFRPLTLLRIAQSSLIMFLPLALSVLGRSSDLLVWGHTTGLLMVIVAWLTVFPRTALAHPNLAGIARLMAERRRCFIYVLPALFIGTLAGNLPQLAVNWRFGQEAAGHLALAQRVLGVPLSLVGVAVRDVFKRYASVAFRARSECAREFWSSFAVLAVVAVGFGLAMLPLSEPLFVLVFGKAWRASGEMARWLLPMFIVGIIASPLTYLVYIVEREDFDLYWQSALLVVAAFTLTSFGGLATTLKTFAASYAAMYVLYIVACARFAGGHNTRLRPAR